MPTPKLAESKRKHVLELYKEGHSHREISRRAKVAVGTVRNVLNGPELIERSDKKAGEFNWREWSSWIQDGQKLKKKASHSQDFATVKLGDGSHPVLLVPFSDQHIGAWGADYDLLQKFTDELLRAPHVYIALLGDYAEFAIKLRSVLETTSQVIPPDMQVEFVESWFDEIWPKVAFATFDNHTVEREEKASGVSTIKRLLSKKVTYFNGIGHVDVEVGKETYRIACSHRFRAGSSQLNPCASMMRYMRFEGVDREICMQGDTHKPGMIKYKDGNVMRTCLNAGTLHTNSGYAKRWFSLFTCSDYPCLVLYPDKHTFSPFWSLQEAMEAMNWPKQGRRV